MGEAPAAGALMGTKAILNEYVAYLELAACPPAPCGPQPAHRDLCAVRRGESGERGADRHHHRHAVPRTRRKNVAGLGMKSWLAGNLATAMTGAVIGLVTWG
jgi:concentrative nucleoside transporter, CNT family